ncbi:ATP-binding protein [Streptomyces sp. NPDC005876]|uniref:ATP-binding protein n=1 Tax=Streptomyces sp. NPDC005876 TaxID=3157076 RepID=UPI00340A1EF4
MDPNDRGPEEYGHDGDGRPPRPPRDPLTPDFGQHAPAPARMARLVTGDFLLTVNPVDGSEIEVCPPTERPARPEKRTPAERAETERAARPPVPPGPARPALPLLARDDERDRLVRLLARGRSVRLTGPAGSGRTSLLDVVAEDCADLAPDGVVRLSGFHRTADDLLHDLFHAVHRAPLHRPAREELLDRVREIGAVVLLDDAEFGGTALDELLEATPECAFLVAATPDVPAPSPDLGVEEVFLPGLDRGDGVALLERAAGRPLTEEEANWAGDLWFESEGLPLRFVQAGALLRHRDRLRAGADAVDEFGVFADSAPEDAIPYDTGAGDDVPLPSLGEAAAPAPLLASRLSACARAALKFAVALGGEVPHPAHLPALIGDTHADAALGELAACGLISPVGSRYRLAAGVLTQLESAGYADDVPGRALDAARHYAWWAGHPSVTPERVRAEADALLAALAVLAPGTEPPAEDEESPAVALARTAAPAFAAGLHWGAWERSLRSGAEAARLAGDVAEQAYFHHELGVLALCEDRLDRARAELEASIGLRGAAADRRGTVAGRRALALVIDRSGDTPGMGAGTAFGAPTAPADPGTAAEGFGAVAGGPGAAAGGFGAVAGDAGATAGGPGAVAGGSAAVAGGPGTASGGFAAVGGPGAAAGGPGAAAGGPGAAVGGFGAVAGGFGATPGGFGAVAGGSGATPGGYGATPTDGPGPAAGTDGTDARYEQAPAPFPPLRPAPQAPTLVAHRASGRPGGSPSRKARGGIKGFAKRNLVAAGAGALLVAVLGTVVTLGATSDGDTGGPADRVGVNPSAGQDTGDDNPGADRGDDGSGDGGTGDPGIAGVAPTDPGPDGTPGTSDDPRPTGSATPSDDPSGTRRPSGSADPSATTKPPTSGKPSTGTHKPPSGTQKPPTGSQTPSDTPSTSTDPETPSSPTQDPETPSSPVTSATAGDPTTVSSAPGSAGATASGTAATGQIM